jgi:hypothetical protein
MAEPKFAGSNDGLKVPARRLHLGRGDSRTKFKWRVGDRVRAGQPIAWISDTAMLHFETYRKGTRRNEHYYPGHAKPKHLLNPTQYLLELRDAGHH